MNLELSKLELIQWIAGLRKKEILKKLIDLKSEQESELVQPERTVRKYGSLKGTFTYVAEDFDEPLDEFKEYGREVLD